MPAILRLRQVCLAAPRLAPVLDDLQAILGLSICHRDPGLATYGLENALLPLGTDFLEVVSPLHAGTAAGRFIQRSRGHGGYMAIFQVDDPAARQAAAAALGVRTAHQIDRADYQSVQLHPRDCRAAFIEFGRSAGDASRQGAWWPAGPHWQTHVRSEVTQRLAGIVLESADPADLAAHWSRLLALPLGRDADGRPLLQTDQAWLAFAPGPADALGSLVLVVADAAAALDRAVDRGHRVDGKAFHLAGVHFQLLEAAGAPA